MPIWPNEMPPRPEGLDELEQIVDNLLPIRKKNGVAVIFFREISQFTPLQLQCMSVFINAEYQRAGWTSVRVETVPDGRDMKEEVNFSTAFVFYYQV